MPHLNVLFSNIEINNELEVFNTFNTEIRKKNENTFTYQGTKSYDRITFIPYPLSKGV